jgi:3-isopropylmalate/(R)-2-methylmalate dehydratase large subunit
MTIFTFAPRFLFLSQEPKQIIAQLNGKNLTLVEASPLRDDISTDEITPVAILSHYDDKLARYAHTGFKA